MEIKEKIQQRAWELFKRFGIRSVTMDAIASECGISKKTVYQFFEDKNELVESIMLAQISCSETKCALHVVDAQNAVEQVFLTADMVQEMMEGVNLAMMYDLRKYHNHSFENFEKHKHQFIYSVIKKNIERGIAEGLYRPDVNVEIITQYQLANLTIVFEQDVFPKQKYALTEIDYEITLYNLYGLATTNGIKLIEKYKQERQKQK